MPSTQDVARAQAADGGTAVVIAERQTGGRGRSGAEWLTAPRAVAVSVAFRTRRQAADRAVIPLIAGVAAVAVVGDRLTLKWPNDLLLGADKVGGILVEAHEDLVVAGLGLNLYWPDPPDGIGALETADPGPTAAATLAEKWAAGFLALESRPGWPRPDYLAACATVGTDVTWEPGGAGRAVDVGPDGALVVHTDGGEVQLGSGAVRHVRAAG